MMIREKDSVTAVVTLSSIFRLNNFTSLFKAFDGDSFFMRVPISKPESGRSNLLRHRKEDKQKECTDKGRRGLGSIQKAWSGHWFSETV